MDGVVAFLLGLAHAAHAGQRLSTRRTAKAAQGTRWLTLSRLAVDIGQGGLAVAIRTSPKKAIASLDTAQGLAACRTGMSGCDMNIRQLVQLLIKRCPATRHHCV